MTLWRLEWLRLVRTKRLAALLGVYVFFGMVGPLIARYLGELVERFGGTDVTIEFPDPAPADGLAQFVSNASQVGVLVAVAVAAGALTIDALPEMSIFLRTRVREASRIVLPRYVVATAAVGAAYLAGLLAAWYETAVLLGGVPVGGLIAGLVYGVLYLAFAVAVVAAIGSRLQTVIGTVGLSVVVLLVMPIAGVVDTVGRWLPSHLVAAQVALAQDAAITDYLGAAAVTVVAIVGLVAVAVRGVGSREL